MIDFESLFQKTCVHLGHDASRYNVWLTFMSPRKIRQLNFNTREINKPTDVLSYPLDIGDGGDIIELGDIVICKRMCRRKKMPVEYAYVHGLLHLFGYDHETADDEAKMTAQTEAILYE